MKFPPIWQKFQENPVILGIGIIVILLFGLLLHEYLLDNLTVIFEPGSWRYHDFRIAVIHCILAGYLPAVYFYGMRGTRNNINELEKVLVPVNVTTPTNIGKRSLIFWGLVGMMIAVFIPYLTAQSPGILLRGTLRFGGTEVSGFLSVGGAVGLFSQAGIHQRDFPGLLSGSKMWIFLI